MSDHPWCRDVPRDEAIRRAEDAAAVPSIKHRDLPAAVEALAERVARLEAVTPPREAATDSHENVNANGLRTERVTLEITHNAIETATKWPWKNILSGDDLWGFWPDKGESVRVVDETEAMTCMTKLRRERDAARAERDEARAEAETYRAGVRTLQGMLVKAEARVAELEAASKLAPAANAGGEKPEPVAWAIRWHEGSPLDDHLFNSEKVATIYKTNGNTTGTVIPLYTEPPEPRGWLTAEEREAIEWMCNVEWLPRSTGPDVAAPLRSLLARSTPPRVKVPSDAPAHRRRDDQWIAAIREAGGEVGE